MTESPLQELLPPRGEHLILYDGVCGLCNRLNRFVLLRDTRAAFDFASLQSPTGRSVLQPFGKNTENLNTFYVVANYRSESPALLSKARAVLFVLKTLDGGGAWFWFFRIFPNALLDIGYDLIARNRYWIFGQSKSCLMPSVEFRKRFIDV
jgi:predicted DCC family thiol-disulfide oxidoreductase YuxK